MALDVKSGDAVNRGCEYNLPLPSHGFSLRTAFQNVWDPLQFVAFSLKQCLDLTGERRTHVNKV